MFGQSPGRADASAVEWRARQIEDPVARLRFLRGAMETKEEPRTRVRWRRMSASALIVLTVLLNANFNHAPVRASRPAKPLPRPAPVAVAKVWLVEKAGDYEVYSNGLRIENGMAVANEPRSYWPLGREAGQPSGQRRTQPVGIVFHATESEQLPFEADRSQALQRIGKNLLSYVRSKRAYHFVIDRFGRVHRIVQETDAANHAGHSVWADWQWAYLDLNAAFLGVAFEAQANAERQIITDAQVHSARVLTEMLRSKYDLPAENCVTHAQVSVNPSSMVIGWHTDWGAGFPFRALGLPENYEQPNPGMYLFGFHYDTAYLNATCPAVWKGLTAGEEQLHDGAARRGLGLVQFRRLLQKRYRQETAAIRRYGAAEGN